MQAGDCIRNTAAYVVTDDIRSVEPKLLRELVNVFRHRRGFIVALNMRRATDASQINSDNPEL